MSRFAFILAIIATLFGATSAPAQGTEPVGVWLTENINTVEKGLTWLTGRHLFNPEVYYFTEIPTDLQWWTVFLVNVGAVTIAVVFSVLPAMRAAMLHPVRALRYE